MKVALVNTGERILRIVYVKKGIYAGAYARIVSEQEDRITAQVGPDIFPLRNDEFRSLMTAEQLASEILLLPIMEKDRLYDMLNVYPQY